MEAMMYRMRMAAMGFAALVVLGVLFFVEDEKLAEETVAPGLTREAPVVRAPAPERVPGSEPPAVDRPSEFTADDDLIDNTEGLSTEGFETQGFDTGGLEPEPDLNAEPVIDTTFEYAIVLDDGGGS